MAFWITVIALGVALGVVLGAILLAIVHEVAYEIAMALMSIGLIAYLVFLYFFFTRGWFKVVLDWLSAAIHGITAS